MASNSRSCWFIVVDKWAIMGEIARRQFSLYVLDVKFGSVVVEHNYVQCETFHNQLKKISRDFIRR